MSTRGQGLGLAHAQGQGLELGFAPGPGPDHVPHFTRILTTLPPSSVDIWINLPYSARSWLLWDNIRHQSNSDKKLFLALEFTSVMSLREEDCQRGLVEKWIAEPIKV